MTIPYTICFCRSGGKILMIHRSSPPNAGLWNGLGGKIAPGESPLGCARREVLEEAGIDLGAAELRFSGPVRWPAGVDPTGQSTGMHAYVADLPGDELFWEGARGTPEGVLAWRPVSWACDPANDAVVDNVPRFLPGMLAGGEPMEYRCAYADGKLVDVVAHPL